MRRVDVGERRARLAVRHRLATPGPTVEAAAESMVGLHASDPATVFLAAWARVRSFRRGDLERALYDDRTLLRMVGMRRTLFVVPPDVAEVMDAACTKALGPPERRRLVRLLEQQSIADDGGAWLDRVCRSVLESLNDRGEATATELTEDVPELGLKFTYAEGKAYGGQVGISTRILFLLATEGRIVRGRPRGRWLSSLYAWTPTERWLGQGLPDIETAAAQEELVRRWLWSFGPGTLTDIRWWTGLTSRDTRRALAGVGAVEVDVEAGVGYLLADDLEPVVEPEPWVALLPGLDPTPMGWKERAWYFGDHATMLFDRNGNAGPTVWCDGRVVGGWAQRAEGEVVLTLMEDIGGEAERAVAATAERLTDWLAGSVITPRFRTPLERQLASPRPGSATDRPTSPTP
jgi:hypothetical protein